MKALVYRGKGQRSWEEVPLPTLQDGRGAVVQIDATTIGGTDLHILRGDVPEVTPGRILGHEAVGIPRFETATRLVRRGGHVANIGVHGAPATLHLESLWIEHVTITTGLADTLSTPRLAAMVAGGQLDTSRFLTHRFQLDEMMQAYEVFADAQASHALKVVLKRN